MADAFAIVPFDDSDDEGTVSMAAGGGGGGAVATRVTFRVAVNPKAVRDHEGEGVSIHGSIQVTNTLNLFMLFACAIFFWLTASLHASMNPSMAAMLSHHAASPVSSCAASASADMATVTLAPSPIPIQSMPCDHCLATRTKRLPSSSTVAFSFLVLLQWLCLAR